MTAPPRIASDRSGITLTAEQAAALDRVLAQTGETAADWVRRMIVEQSALRASASADAPRETG